ncbi:MAG: glucose-6-phosphate dehydrogenase assembly protein OpcA, partial [Acidobacteriota bacterium]
AARANYRLDETLIEVTAHHPSRAIVLIEDEEASGPSLNSWVTSRCTLPTAHTRQVCCEQITIKASRDKVREAPSAISSLILADLPVFLWWRERLRPSDALFRRCTSLSDRLLIDTAKADFAEDGFAEIVQFMQTHPRVPIADLNWTRLLTWRSVLAGFYDAADHRRALDALEEVDISYHADADAGLTPRALYLGCWLASRLGWQLNRNRATRDHSGARFSFSHRGREIVVLLRAVHGESDRVGHLNQVSLKCGLTAGQSSSFSVSKTADGRRLAASVTLEGVKRPERILGYDQWNDSSLLAVELEGVARDRVFEQAALLANEMIQSIPES